MSDKDYEFLFKVVIIGNTLVGKTKLTIRYSDNTWNDKYLPTIGVDFVR